MPTEYTQDYLLDKKVKIYQPQDGYRASADAVLLSALITPEFANASILDVGSDTGAVSLCLAQRLHNNNVTIHGLEIQPALAELANMSAKANQFDFLHYTEFDIRSQTKLSGLATCSFDAVVTNPPYSEHDMPSPNKSKAFAHNHQNFGLEQWLQFCLKMAKPFGRIYMVNRTEALPEICSVLHGKAGNITVIPVYSKKGQDSKRILVSAQKDSKAPCRILKPFVVHTANGEYTLSAQKILRKGLSFMEI